MKSYTHSLLVGEELSVTIEPLVLESEQGVKDVNSDTRGCLLQDEGDLESSNIYSFSNCLVECKAKIIQDLCQCIPYFFPLERRNYCTLADVPCLVQNQGELFLTLFKLKVSFQGELKIILI